jgi:hypothetical protein
MNDFGKSHRGFRWGEGSSTDVRIVFFGKVFVRKLLSAEVQIDNANQQHNEQSAEFSGVFNPRRRGQHGMG